MSTNLLTLAASLTVAGEVRRRFVKPEQAGEGGVDGSGRSRPGLWTAIGPDKLKWNLIYMTACGTDKSDKSVLHRSVFARLLELGSFNLSSAVLPIYSFR